MSALTQQGTKPTSLRSPRSATDYPEQDKLVGLATESQRGAAAHGAAAHGGSRVAGTRHFFRHFGEMFVAMMVGMMVLGGVDGGVLSVFGTTVPHVRNSAPEVFALVMALNMTVGMTLWMRYRRHSWAMCWEMAGAMFVPAILAIVLFRAGVIDGPAAGGVLMGAMVPAMLGVMLLRRRAYSQPVHSHGPRRPAKVEAGRR